MLNRDPFDMFLKDYKQIVHDQIKQACSEIDEKLNHTLEDHLDCIEKGHNSVSASINHIDDMIQSKLFALKFIDKNRDVHQHDTTKCTCYVNDMSIDVANLLKINAIHKDACVKCDMIVMFRETIMEKLKLWVHVQVFACARHADIVETIPGCKIMMKLNIAKNGMRIYILTSQ